MQYMGSKNRHAKEIIPIITAGRKPGQAYVEPFVGGANVIDKVDGVRIGADSHPHLICLLNHVASGWKPPEFVSEEEYTEAKKEKSVNPQTAFIGFLCSFGAKWFGGYARNAMGTNYAKTGMNSLLKQSSGLKGVEFVHSRYQELIIPKDSIIYCDPPYEGTTGYSTGKFDHAEFWQWCRDKTSEGHKVFVSEYAAPDDFVCVWEKSASANFDSNRSGSSERVERLFVHESQHNGR